MLTRATPSVYGLASETRPSVDDLTTLFRDLENAKGIVLAVSGGPDSTALMHLAAAWHANMPMPLSVATVDHGLRAGSDLEARRVADAAQQLGLPTHILQWEGAKPTRAVQERARLARYALLDGLVPVLGASHLVTAHTLDDQAETVLFRLARGSGVSGAAGMRRTVLRGTVTHMRPFLQIRKSSLVATCRANGWPFFDDPANADCRFARTRWRSLADSLAAEGLTPERLGVFAGRAARADEALMTAAAEVAGCCELDGPAETRRLDASALFGRNDELVLRVLDAALVDVAGRGRTRLNRLEALLARLREAGRCGSALTLTQHGCLVGIDASGILTIRREPSRRRGQGPQGGPNA